MASRGEVIGFGVDGRTQTLGWLLDGLQGWLGDVAGLAIPAGQDAFETIHDCPGETTEALFSEPLHVYGSWLHAHRLGKALWTEQRRDGVRIGELGRNDPYDFGLQYVEPLDATLEPGDELVTHCVYDSSDRTEPTNGGEGSDDEMCLNYLFHYPARLRFRLRCIATSDRGGVDPPVRARGSRDRA